jgi:hypothetical protein
MPTGDPIGFFWNGDEVVVCTATTAPKVRALTARPEVALTIDVGHTSDTAKALLIRGSTTSISSTASRTSTSRGRGRYWARKASPSSKATSERCTTRWRASVSSRAGHASTTSAPDGCRPSSRSWQSRTRRRPLVTAAGRRSPDAGGRHGKQSARCRIEARAGARCSTARLLSWTKRACLLPLYRLGGRSSSCGEAAGS